jgi:translation initiation factor 4E
LCFREVYICLALVPLNFQEEKHTQAISEAAPERHPLQNKWALWYFKSDKNKEWKDNLKLVISFDTVEDFWS